MARNFLMRPIGRGAGNPLMPGTHRRLSGLNIYQGSNTYIQNNFFGGTPSYGNYWNSFGGGCGYGCGGGGGNKFMNWMMGIGMVSMFAGFMTNLFGPGKGGTAVETAPRNSGRGTTFAPTRSSGEKEKSDEADASEMTALKAKQKSADEQAAKLGLKAGDIQVVQDADGNVKYIYKGKKFDSIDSIETEINKGRNSKGTEDKTNAKPDAEDDNKALRRKQLLGNDWVNNYYSKPGDVPPVAKDPELVAQMKKTGIMSKGSTPEDIINKFVNKELEQMGYEKLSDKAKSELILEIIEHNPSIFDEKTGNVKQDADYKKLDVPGVNYVLSKFNLKKSSTEDTELGEWNHHHPDKQVATQIKDGKKIYTTTVKVNDKELKVSASSFEDLKKAVQSALNHKEQDVDMTTKTTVGFNRNTV